MNIVEESISISIVLRVNIINLEVNDKTFPLQWEWPHFKQSISMQQKPKNQSLLLAVQ